MNRFKFGLVVFSTGLLLACYFSVMAWPKELAIPKESCLPTPEFLEKVTSNFPQANDLPGDMQALFEGYCGNFQGVDVGDEKELLFIMNNGDRVIYDDGRQKSFEEKLNNPDLEDMLEQTYRPGPVAAKIPVNWDPGRFRVGAFFNKVYGASSVEVRKNMVKVNFCGIGVWFNSRNNAAAALEKVNLELSALIKNQPQLRRYIKPLGGSFNWRVIAGTQRLSPHAWGIAVDLNAKHGAYWRWGKKTEEALLKLRNDYPAAIVEIFEKNKFIWGGKWYHYDLMHFEYRPELFIKTNLTHIN